MLSQIKNILLQKKVSLIILTIVLFTSLLLGLSSAEIYKQNQATDLKFTCTLNNAIPSSSTTYNVTIVYPNGSTFVNNKGASALGQGAFNYTIIPTELGNYKVLSFCYDGAYSFSNEEFIEITESGEKVSLSSIIVVIVFIFFSILSLFLGNSFNTEKYILKSFFYLIALLSGLLAINSARIIASESLNLSKMTLTGLIISITIVSVMFLYIMVVYMINTFKAVKDKQGVRWQY